MDANRRRDARLGALILAMSVAGLGLVAIITAAQDLDEDPANSEISALRTIMGWVLLGLAVMLVMLGLWAARGGRRTRYSLAVISLGFGGLLILLGLPTMILATPFFVSAYLLLRSLPSRCETAPRWLIETVNSGMLPGTSLDEAYVGTASGLTGPEIVESHKFADAWWIVGKIVGVQDSAEVGVWVTNELDETNPGLIFAANSGASKYSDWGADLGEPVGGDGSIEVRNCL